MLILIVLYINIFVTWWCYGLRKSYCRCIQTHSLEGAILEVRVFKATVFRVIPFVDLHLIFEISSLQTWFFVYFKLDFYCLCSLQNSSSKYLDKKSSLSNWFFRNQLQINRGLVTVFPSQSCKVASQKK